uniref:DH domain-containing protein n=1 Tax=Denticeps clupeoides TaxID=299321 RepID=A0AAY3ZWX7_9TELE
FTVCGERIKLVQNVRPGETRTTRAPNTCFAAGSCLMSVCPPPAGTYVALTLQGQAPSAVAVPLQPLPTDILTNHKSVSGSEASPPPPPPPLPPSATSTPSQRITGPKPLQDPEVQKHASQILRKMLQQEEAELQPHSLVVSCNPENRKYTTFFFIEYFLHVCVPPGRLSLDSSEGDFEVREQWRVMLVSPLIFFPFMSKCRRVSGRWRLLLLPSCCSLFRFLGNPAALLLTPLPRFISPSRPAQMDGPFQDIELLKMRPAHMTVFMRYIFSQLLDPSPLLFYLSVEAYLGSSPKDARSLAPQICSHFLDPDAVSLPHPDTLMALCCCAESRLQVQEDIRGPLSELQQQVLPDIQDQIQDYRSKQMMGLGSLFGEGDLQQLDGDPSREKQVVDQQVTALWDLLSPLASVVLLYLRHCGIKLRDSRLFPGVSTEKEKWLAFFPKTKRLSGGKEKKDGEDRRRNPILKYIGKPRSTSQSTFHVPLSPTEVRPGNVRNIIQQFENNGDGAGEDGGEAEGQRLSSSSLGDDGMESPTISVRLARSESLKAHGEGRRRGGGTGAESVPRSRSDVDMEDCEEREEPGLRLLHQSTSSSASSSSLFTVAYVIIINTGTPYRSMEAPVALLPDVPALEEDASDSHNWQETVGTQILASLSSREIDRQAVIYELYTTEASHLRTLRVLDQVFFQRMRAVLNTEELSCIFPNLQQVYELHASLCESMKKLRESPIVQGVGDIMLARFEGVAGEEFQEQVSQLCSQQSQALELIKSKQRKDLRFAHLIQECEASPHCRRLQLKDLLVSEMQRLTKYPLLLDNIIKHTEGNVECRAQACCRGILQTVNEVVRETEHRLRLGQYQRRLDISALERQANPVAVQFKNLDLTTKRMIHEGPLTWKVSKDKTLEMHALLLSDLLVLLQKGADDRLILRCPSRGLGGATGGVAAPKTTFCPIVRLDSLLVRSVATDNKGLYVISASEGQIYELVAGTSSEKNTWKEFLEKTISQATENANAAKPGSAPASKNPPPLPGGSLTERSGSMETDQQSDEDTPTTPTDQSESFLHADDQAAVLGGVAEAALHDGEDVHGKYPMYIRFIFSDQ